MAIISKRAIKNNKNLSGKEISAREAIAAFCTTLDPSTDEKQGTMAELIGESSSHFSTYVGSLIKKGEIAKENGRFYQLKLDDWQLKKIKEENPKMLETLAVVGCADAAEIVIELTDDTDLLRAIANKYTDDLRKKAIAKVTDIETKVTDIETVNDFLFHFFLLSSYEYRNKSFNICNPQVTDIETKVTDIGTAYKEGFNKYDLNPNEYERSGNFPTENSTHATDENSTGSLPAGKPTIAALKNAPPSSAGKPADLRINHPAVKMVKEITKRFPKKEIWDRVIREVGDKPDIEFFRKCFEIWVSFDGNPQNLDQWLFKPNDEKKEPERFERKSKKSSNDDWKTVGKNDEELAITNCEPEEHVFLSPIEREEVLNQAIEFAERKDVFALLDIEMQLHPDDWQWIETQLKILKKSEIKYE